MENMRNKAKIALVSDFDGTISGDDFFFYVTAKYLDKEALEPWDDYLSGKKQHFEALKEIFAKIKVDEDELDDFIEQIEVDVKFFDTATLCNRLNIPIYICSAGCDYYIRLLLGEKLDEYGVTLITNPSFYSKKLGLQITRPQRDEYYYDQMTGVDKSKVVLRLKSEGYFVVYCGDGIPDVGAARVADVVFARKTLEQICIKEKIAYKLLTDFTVVLKYIEEKSR